MSRLASTAGRLRGEALMGYLEYLKDFFTVASVLSLIAIGFMISLKSGVVAVGGDRCRLVLGNLTHLVVGIAACLLFLMMVQQLVGLRVHLP
jgi:ABC-type uncharacterized transport system permease subunit